MTRFVLGFLVAVAVFAAVGLGTVYSGAYNVAASSPHTGLETWVLNTMMRNSVRHRAAEVAVPAGITEEQIRRGEELILCAVVVCHHAGLAGRRPLHLGSPRC